jgi:hypothetical protein
MGRIPGVFLLMLLNVTHEISEPLRLFQHPAPRHWADLPCDHRWMALWRLVTEPVLRRTGAVSRGNPLGKGKFGQKPGIFPSSRPWGPASPT